MRRGWHDDTRTKRENEREGRDREGRRRKRVRKESPPSRGGSCAGAPVNEVVG